MKFLILLFSCLSCYAQFPYSGTTWPLSSAASGDYNYASIPGLYIELFANSTTNWNVSTVNHWLDLSGQNNTFTTDVGSSPTYSQVGPASYYALDFGANGGTEYVYCTNVFGSNIPNTFVVVATDACGSGGNCLYDTAAGAQERLILGTSGSATIYAGVSVALPNFHNSSNWMIISAVFNGVNSAIRTNGVLMKTTGLLGGQGMGQFEIGNNLLHTLPYAGKITAVLAWGRALATNELYTVESQLNTKYGFGLTINSNGFDPGSIWADRVVLNGASYPSDNSKVSITSFLNGLITDGTYLSTAALLLYPTDSLIAATTPVTQILAAGSDPWVNHNFVTGDLTVNGLKGNTTTKYLDSGIVASTSLTANNTALFSYAINIGTASGVDIGSTVTGNTGDILLISDLTGTTYSDQYNATAGAGRVSTATHTAGYYCGSRTSSSSHNIYYAKTGTAHSSIASSATSGGGLPGFSIFAFVENNNGTPAVFSDITSGASGIALGLTSGQSSSLYNRLVTFRTAMGGTNP